MLRLVDLRWGTLGCLFVLTCALVAVRPTRALRSPPRIGPRANPTSSWWLERLPAGAAPRPAPRPPSSADVVVIGAGMTGCAIAFHLRELRPELECVVLDARGVAGGATGRNGGHLWANPTEAFERRTVKDLLRFIDEHDVECDLTRAGAAALERAAPDDAAPDDAGATDSAVDPEAAFSALEWDESRNTNWTAAECAEHLGSRAFFRGATVFADALQFFPAKVTAALLRASCAALCAPARVVRIADAAARASRTPRGREIELAVETADGAAPTTLRCRHVVVATNAWAPELLPELAPWLRPTRNQVLMTSPIANRPGPAWSGVGGVSVDEGARELYAIARADGRVCVGGARSLEPGAAIGSTDDASLSDEVGAHLRAFLRDAFPRSFGAESAPGSWRVEAEWTGVLGFTSDGRPIVGELPGRPGVLVAAGFCGHGMPQCYGVARSIAHMIAGEHERVDPHVRERMDPARFVSRTPPAPG